MTKQQQAQLASWLGPLYLLPAPKRTKPRRQGPNPRWTEQADAELTRLISAFAKDWNITLVSISNRLRHLLSHAQAAGRRSELYYLKLQEGEEKDVD